MARRSRPLGVSRARRIAAFAALATSLAACSLLTGLDADYKLKGTGGSEGGPEADGPAKPDGPATDGSQDDGSSTDSSTPRFCDALDGGPNTEDYFCTDFEDAVFEANGIATGWTAVKNTLPDGGATLKLLPEAGNLGLSRGLEVESYSASVTTGRQTRLDKTLPTNKPADQYLAYEIDFDFRVLKSELDYTAISLLVFMSKEHGLAAYESGPEQVLSREAPAAPLPMRITNDFAWHHLKLRLTHDTAGTPFAREIKIDNVVVDNAPTGHIIAAGATTELRLGIHNTGNKEGRALAQFDNVVFRRRP